VACALFNVLDAKDRKIVVKSLQEPLKEMCTNKIAHLFLIHVVNNLDDTVISKKKILQDVLLTQEENANDRSFQNIFIGIIHPKSKRFFTEDEIKAFDLLHDKTTSKKDDEQRRKELISIVTQPLEKFYEEHMQFYLMDVSKNPLLARVFEARIELGEIEGSDCFDEMFRQI
jgi:hypothetical protein